MEPSLITWLYIGLAATTSTILINATSRIFKSLNIPPLTAPFIFTTLSFLLVSSQLSLFNTTQNISFAEFPKAITSENLVSATTIWEGMLHGVSQVFFQQNILTGLLFLLGLLVSKRSSFAMALIGSLVGFTTGWLLDADQNMLGSGLFGFNSVLTAIALGSVFLKPGPLSFIFPFLGSAITTVAFSAVSAAFAPIGIPVMTLPFVVITWIFLTAYAHIQNRNKY